MKLKKIIATVAAVFALGTSAFAFEWSEFWKNYGGGIEKGDMLLSAGVNLNFDYFTYFGYGGGYAIPPVSVDFEIAQPIWVLPFTFGGYARVGAFGYSDRFWMDIAAGGLAKYHVQLPPEKLDVYLGLKLGVKFYVGYDFAPGFDQGGYVLGASYFFSDNFAVNAEVGYPNTRVAAMLKF